jgi:SNF2 family DNA or RNA helicase
MEYKFNNDPSYRVLVVNSKKGAYGLNLQAGNYVMYFESPVSGIDRDQSEKRCHRTGQSRTCFIYDLIMVGSMDERILRYMQEGKDLFKSLVTNPALVLKDASHGNK